MLGRMGMNHLGASSFMWKWVTERDPAVNVVSSSLILLLYTNDGYRALCPSFESFTYVIWSVKHKSSDVLQWTYLYVCKESKKDHLWDYSI